MLSSSPFGFGIFSEQELEEFREGKNIEKCLLRSWVYIEYHMFQAFSKHFDFVNDSANQKWIATFGEGGKSTSFERKFQLLKKLNLFLDDEVQIIAQFQEDRNKIFHSMGSLILANFGDESKRVVEDALKADLVMQDFERRKYLAPSLESIKEKQAREK